MRSVTLVLAVLIGTAPSYGEAARESLLFSQLSDPSNAAAAEQKLELDARKDPQLLRQIELRLPSLILEAKQRSTLYQLAGLAANLKAVGSIPALASRLEDRNEIFMSVTFTQYATMQDDPIARALVSIGDASVPALAKMLRSQKEFARVRAARALKLLNTPSAHEAIGEYIESGAKDDAVRAVLQDQ